MEYVVIAMSVVALFLSIASAVINIKTITLRKKQRGFIKSLPSYLKGDATKKKLTYYVLAPNYVTYKHRCEIADLPLIQETIYVDEITDLLGLSISDNDRLYFMPNFETNPSYDEAFYGALIPIVAMMGKDNKRRFHEAVDPLSLPFLAKIENV